MEQTQCTYSVILHIFFLDYPFKKKLAIALNYFHWKSAAQYDHSFGIYIRLTCPKRSLRRSALAIFHLTHFLQNATFFVSRWANAGPGNQTQVF